jgi:CDGSH-type Zn-finger protein
MARSAAKTTKPRNGETLIEVAPGTAILQRSQQIWLCQCSKWEWKSYKIGGHIIVRKECVEYADCEVVEIDISTFL